MSELTDDRLLPCPGCGRNVGAPHDDEGDGLYFVDCAHCGWRGPRAYNLTDAWNRWQRRAAASTSTEGAGVTLADCPVGLFISASGELCLKTEYGNNEGRIDAYIVSSGEFFWGNAPQTIASQRAQIVVPYTLNPPASKVTTDEAEERG